MIGVIGDCCIDRFIMGECKRLCPDAPVPIFSPLEEVANLGMAGNVYKNLQSMGFSSKFYSPESTPTKLRYVDKKTNALIVRVDRNDFTLPIGGSRLQEVLKSKFDWLIVSDYNKGFLDEETIRLLSSVHNVILDTKKILGDWAKEVKYIKLNELEYVANRDRGLFESDIFLNSLIVTLGSGGTDYRYKNYPVDRVEVKDNVGAGDTFVAALAGKLTETNDIYKSIEFANKAATVVVQKRGVTTATLEEICKS